MDEEEDGRREGRGGRGGENREYKSESGSQQAAAVPYSNMTVWVTGNITSQTSPQLAQCNQVSQSQPPHQSLSHPSQVGDV